AALARAIVADLHRWRAETGPRRLVSIFFGGGTPSLMDAAYVGAIVDTAVELWSAEADLEVSLEANPTDAETSRFAAFAAAGVNRLSLGVQALDDEALAFLGRNHDAAAAMRAAERAAALFPRLSLDMIYARPGQTPDGWAGELETGIALGAEHVSPYQLTIESGTPFDRAVGRGRFTPPDADLGAELFETTQAVLEHHGFDAYEVSNHARGEVARSRHNLVYWRGFDYVGAGPGAHGRLTLGGRCLATTAPRKIADYIEGRGFERETLTPLQAAEERLLLGLRIDEGVAFDEVGVLGLSAGKVRDLIEAGLLADDPRRLRATRQGRLVLDRLTAELAS
ncbi:MAG TPA: coproporphyrinogen-III oxidase family protein, partial [Caulobacteraceae bacterium]|nr:coproporphyrinogen-III oxidase family protein [Caulobacteraceae bacterium]